MKKNNDEVGGLFLFEDAVQEKDSPFFDGKYTTKVNIPIYTPKAAAPPIGTLIDKRKAYYLGQEIKAAKGITEEERKFLLEAAERFNAFNYAAIADYYASASERMQDLMEKCALVIVDYDKAIENGFARLSGKIDSLYNEEMGNGDAS